MGQSLEEFLDSLDAPVLLVGEDVRVIAANRAAQVMVSKPQSEIGGELGGNVLGCMHAVEPGGCGKTIHCRECTIRRTVTHTMETGEPCTDVPAFADIGVINANERVQFLISTEKKRGMVLLRINAPSAVEA
jgi:hypothetical protein